jgi:predicted PurR-regulated permease PerM
LHRDLFTRVTVLLLVALVTFAFFAMIRGFFMAIVMAAIFSGLLYPIYRRFVRWFSGRQTVASLITVLLFILIVLIPLGGFIAILVEQALNASKTIGPMAQESFIQKDTYIDWLESIPVIHEIFPDRKELVSRIQTAIEGIGSFVANGLSSITTGTLQFFFLSFIFLFTMFYFLINGKSYLETALYYLPLRDEEEKLLLEKFTKVTAATLKGTFIIGSIQGGLAAVAMYIAGIPNTLFWGVLMAVLSIIPALGPALVWGPASIYLLLQGDTAAGIGLALFGGIVVGNIDNLIRPRLVGKQAQLPDLMIFFGTLGGLAVFGMAGIIIGPILAALFMTMWEIYGETFKDSLHQVTIFTDAKGELEVRDADEEKPQGDIESPAS